MRNYLIVKKSSSWVALGCLLFVTGCAHGAYAGYGADRQITLKAGETLKQVAQRSGITLAELVRANHLDPKKKLRVGQKISIPGKKRVAINRAQVKKPAIFSGPMIDLCWPIDKPVLFREYSEQAKNINEGIDLGAPKNTQVKAAAAGKILHVGNTGTNFGETIIIGHDKPYMTVYSNLGECQVKPGDLVKRGDVIGTVGTSGGVESPRVHFEVRRNRLPVNPIYLLPH